jgi:hypothetical protein
MWPYLETSWCPYCERVIDRPRLMRLHDDGAEFECTYCGNRHTRKEGEDDVVYFFFPADVARAFASDAPPLEIISS